MRTVPPNSRASIFPNSRRSRESLPFINSTPKGALAAANTHSRNAAFTIEIVKSAKPQLRKSSPRLSLPTHLQRRQLPLSLLHLLHPRPLLLLPFQPSPPRPLALPSSPAYRHT